MASRKETYILLAALISSFTAPFMVSAVNLALPAIGDEFGMDAVLLSWVATSYLLSYAIFLVPSGRFADIYGRKKVFVWGLFIFSFGSIFGGLAPGSVTLLIFRVIQGIGSAMTSTTGVAILISVFPIQKRGRVLGLVVAFVYTGLTIGPFAGGLLTQYLSWRSIFLIAGPPGFLVMLLIVMSIKHEWADAAGESFDLIGTIIYAFSLIAIMYGATIMPHFRGVILLVLGFAALLLFGYREIRIDFPVFDVRLFLNNRGFTFSSLAALIHYSGTFAVSFLISLYLQYLKKMEPQEAGTVLMAAPIMMAIVSPIAGRMSDKWEPRLVASTGMAITGAGLFLLSRIGPNTELLYIVLSLALLGFGFALFSSPNMNAIMSSVEKNQYGIASGVAGTMRLLGQMLSMGVATVLFAVLLGRKEITEELHPEFIMSMKISLIVFSILCCIGIFFSISRGKIRNK